jgi:hypothetical protein
MVLAAEEYPAIRRTGRLPHVIGTAYGVPMTEV